MFSLLTGSAGPRSAPGPRSSAAASPPRRARRAGCLAALILAWACVEANTGPPPTLLTLTVNPHNATLVSFDDTVRFTATVRDQHGQQVAGGTVDWTSSDLTVATVDASGLVRSAGDGAAMISATSDGATGTANVSVAQVAAAVTVTPQILRFSSLGDSARLTGTVRDANARQVPGRTVAWTSADTGIATVSASGLVHPVANGTVMISAMEGGLGGSASVTVQQVAASVRLTVPHDSVLVGESVSPRARAFDAAEFAIPDASFRWLSSDPTIAVVDAQGVVIGITPGTVTITVSLRQLNASATFFILPYPEELVLHRFYEATNGDLWQDNTNWLSDAPLILWAGVHLDEMGRVAHLVLPGNGLIGTIPPQIRHLEHLESLHLGSNDLEGPFPVEVTMLSRLKSLDLTYNDFSGPLPPEIGNLTELVSLGIFGNRLNGEIPPEIGNLTKLGYLDLCHNQLTGPIPAEIGNLGDLQFLLLCGIDAAPTEGNRLSGEIPSEIGNLTKLRILDLGANTLEGPIPASIGKLARLDSLNLYSNLLTDVPPQIGGMVNVQTILLYGNRLTSPIPSTIGNLARLRKLNFGIGFTSGNNRIGGEIPAEIGRLSSLEELDLGGNRLTGPVPPEMGNLTRLRQLELGTNHLSGTLPPEIGNLTRLERFAACPDSLGGPIPPEFGKLTRLRALHLCRNRFTGPVPEELGDLASLRQLNLWNNQLTGEIPESLTSLQQLREINWVNNAGLCAPPTPAFQSWLAGLNRWFGDYCGEGARARWDAPGPGGGEAGPGGGWTGAPGGVVGGEGAGCWVTVARRVRILPGAGSAGADSGRMREAVGRRAVPCGAGGGGG